MRVAAVQTASRGAPSRRLFSSTGFQGRVPLWPDRAIAGRPPRRGEPIRLESDRRTARTSVGVSGVAVGVGSICHAVMRTLSSALNSPDARAGVLLLVLHALVVGEGVRVVRRGCVAYVRQPGDGGGGGGGWWHVASARPEGTPPLARGLSCIAGSSRWAWPSAPPPPNNGCSSTPKFVGQPYFSRLAPSLPVARSISTCARRIHRI